MRRFLRVVFFIFIVGLLIIWISFLFRPTEVDRENVIGYYAEKNNSLDVVCIGGSATFVFWEPLQAWHDYGFTSYDFCVNTFVPQAVKYYLIEALKTQAPELFVIDLRPFQYGEEPYLDTNVKILDSEIPLRNCIDQLNYSMNRVKLIQGCVPDNLKKFSFYFDLMKYHSRIDSFFRVVSWKYSLNYYPNRLKGFLFVPKTAPIEFNSQKNNKEVQPLSERLNGVLIDLLNFCKEKDLQVLFVVHPYSITKEDQMKYNYMASTIRQYGFDYLDVNDYDIGLDYGIDFYNENHVNVFGAEKYTGFLGSYIDSRYSFNKDKDAKLRDSWNRDYVFFAKRVEETKQEIIRCKENNDGNTADRQV